ncbi:MAG: hypothetical protein IKZ09_04345 [Clostridia bacterium]|nr:hypothetical protein [Clostridia bacterium]
MKAYFLTASIVLALLLASCSDGAVSQPPVTDAQTNAVAADTTPADMLDARKQISDDLPEKDFGGADFLIVVDDYTNADYIAEQETGALINDAIFRRNSRVAERFNVNLITENGGDSAVIMTNVRNAVRAGDDAYQLISAMMINSAKLAVQNYFYDWHSIENVNLEKPWWNQLCSDTLSIDNKIFMMAGSISPSFLTHTYCVYMNKRLGNDIDLTATIYDTVLDGKWTIDYYSSLVKDTWVDLNGDGKKDEGDQYGLAAQVTSYATPFIYAFGETTVSRDADGMPVLSINEEKAADMVNKVYSLFYESNGTITTDGWSLHQEVFTAGRALFMNGVFVHAIDRFTDMADDYAILPYPKWDEAQTDYLTMSDGASPLVTIPTTCVNIERAGIITEALAAESYKTVIPVIYDTALKVRGVRDETSMQIVDLIERGNVIDFGYVFGDYNMMGFYMSNLMGSKKNNFSSYYERQQRKWEKHLTGIIDSYLEATN